MSKMTQRETAALFLMRHGYMINRDHGTWVASRRGDNTRFFLGSRGSLRQGISRADSQLVRFVGL